MKYEAILEQLKKKEKTTKKEIESEMQNALAMAGLNCTPKEFIGAISFFISERRYIA